MRTVVVSNVLNWQIKPMLRKWNWEGWFTSGSHVSEEITSKRQFLMHCNTGFVLPMLNVHRQCEVI